MSQINSYSIRAICCVVTIISCVIALPLPPSESAYGKFISFLSKNNCKMPENVELPFPQSIDDQPFAYLHKPLEECQMDEALIDTKKVYFLCKEIFEALQNITCFDNFSPVKINTGLSNDVCSDIRNKQNILPKQGDYLSIRLIDPMICMLTCSSKYESLCKVLLWSYDVQAKIESSLPQNSEQVAERPNDANEGTSLENNHADQVSDIKYETENNKQASLKVSVGSSQDLNNELPSINNIENNVKVPTNSLNSTVANNVTLHSSVTTVNSSQSVKSSSQALVTTTLPGKHKTLSKTDGLNTSSKSKELKQTVDILSNSKLTENGKENMLDSESKALPKSSSEISQQKVSETTNESSDKLNSNLNSVADANNTSDNHIEITNADGTSQKKVTQLHNNQSTTESKSKLKEIVVTSAEINGNNFQENGESKVKEPSGSDSQKISNEGNLSENVSQKDLNDLTSDSSKLFQEVTTLQNFDKNEDAEGQDEKEQDLYNNDTENDADYPKSEFDNSFNQLPKTKDSDFKNPVNVPSEISGNELQNNYDGYLISRNNMGHGPDDSVQVIPSFPEQEDSHFFFYFLSIVLILMAGYLIFHNKQKIIALIVEGRHERRRRSHGAGYKKLETK